MSLWEGLTNKHIGRYKEAWNAFAQHAQMQPQPRIRETNRAEFLNYVASVALKQRDLDASVLYVEVAEEVAEAEAAGEAAPAEGTQAAAGGSAEA